MTWGTEKMDALVAREAVPPPVVETLKLGTVDEWKPGWTKKTWLSSPEILNGDGSMFGGYLAALADQALTFATLTVVPNDKAFRTVNLNVQFFKVTRGEPIIIESRVVSQSRKLITVEADFMLKDGTLIAKASAQQILTSFPSGN